MRNAECGMESTRSEALPRNAMHARLRLARYVSHASCPRGGASRTARSQAEPGNEEGHVKLSAQVVNIHKDYFLKGGIVVPALRGVSLDFPQGDFVAIMGASGSGKSTLLNLLGCLDTPTRGKYYLGGQDVSQLDDRELSHVRSRHLGFIFQSYNLIPQLNVVENIQVPLFYQGRVNRQSRDLCVRL